MKIGCVWNNQIRDNGTAFYCERAFDRMDVENTHIQTPVPGKIEKCDWYFSCDDGRDDITYIPPEPSAFWAIDTHLGYDFRLWKAKQYTKVFVAQKDAVFQLKEDGVNAEWLPLACDPVYHINQAECADRFGADSTEQVWDIAFVGFLRDDQEKGYNNRVDYLDALFGKYKNSWFSSRIWFEEMSLTYVKARLGFNISVRNDLNMRVFEVMSTGVPLLTNYDVCGIDELFNTDCYYGYVGIKGMLAAAENALKDTERDQVGERAMRLVRKKHTYDIRMKRIMEVMDGI